MGDVFADSSEDETAATISPDECTEAHVFEHIQEFENQANEELGMSISYGKFPPPFNKRKPRAEVQYEHERDMKNEYLPAIGKALGIRDAFSIDSAEDVALAEANALKWYYVAIRPESDLFTVIKYRSPIACPSFVLQMAGFEHAYSKHRHFEDFDAFVPCGTLETADVNGVEPLESEAVAKRLWRLALQRGGSTTLLTPKEGGCHAPWWSLEAEGGTKTPWMRMPPAALDGLWYEANPSAAQLAAERAAQQQQQQQRLMQPQTMTIVRIPEGVVPGQALRVQAPDGRTLQVNVPPGASAGMNLTIQIPPRPLDAVTEAVHKIKRRRDDAGDVD